MIQYTLLPYSITHTIDNSIVRCYILFHLESLELSRLSLECCKLSRLITNVFGSNVSSKFAEERSKFSWVGRDLKLYNCALPNGETFPARLLSNEKLDPTIKKLRYQYIFFALS